MSWKKLSVMVKNLCPLTPRRGRQVQDQQAGQEANPVLRLQAPRSSSSWRCQRNSPQGTTPSTVVICILTTSMKLFSGKLLVSSHPQQHTVVQGRSNVDASECVLLLLKYFLCTICVGVSEQSGDSGREVNIQDNGTKAPSVHQTYLFEHLSKALIWQDFEWKAISNIWRFSWHFLCLLLRCAQIDSTSAFFSIRDICVYSKGELKT